jgi:PTH1 family peptidyl-tRNA hydrolase
LRPSKIAAIFDGGRDFPNLCGRLLERTRGMSEAQGGESQARPVPQSRARIQKFVRLSTRWLARRARDADADSGEARKLIIGLGNPGPRYARNRHNVGFIVLDRLAAAQHLAFGHRRFNAQLADGHINGQRILLAKPQTYMNLSGSSVTKLVAFYRVSIHDIIVIYDDLDLPLGRIRLRARGGAGGHHGMESIIAALGDNDFARLRIGIGRPDTREDIGHVLGNFSVEESKLLDEIIPSAIEAIMVWLREGIEKAMNEFNSR